MKNRRPSAKGKADPANGAEASRVESSRAGWSVGVATPATPALDLAYDRRDRGHGLVEEHVLAGGGLLAHARLHHAVVRFGGVHWFLFVGGRTSRIRLRASKL